jgi:hypothetical protein
MLHYGRWPAQRDLDSQVNENAGSRKRDIGMQAALLMTHIESEAITQHFERLKRETRGLLDVFLCVHASAPSVISEGRSADFTVSSSIEARTLPNRYAEKMRRGGTILPGFCDLTYMPVLLTELSDRTHVWVIEYDVDFAGSWSSFFSPLLSRPAELLGTTFYRKSQCLGWMWWSTFEAPAEVAAADYVRSFIPIVRLSRGMIDCYAKAVESGSWHGHAEALFPTIAGHNGLMIEDIGGHGPFTPPSLRGKNYFNNPLDGRLMPGSLTTRPPKQTDYFHVAPNTFPLHDYLYHPVKARDVLDVSTEGWSGV